MNKFIRRRIIRSEEKGPIVNTYHYTRSVTAYTGGRDNLIDFNFKIGASYTFVLAFSGGYTYLRLLIGTTAIEQKYTNPATISFDYTTSLGSRFNAFIWKPAANGTLTVDITETIPRT